jgi:hypothetical protein
MRGKAWGFNGNLSGKRDGAASAAPTHFLAAPGMYTAERARLYVVDLCLWARVLARHMYHPPQHAKTRAAPPLSSYRIAQRPRAHFTPQHWLLCNMEFYQFKFDIEFLRPFPERKMDLNEQVRSVMVTFS